MQLGYDKTEESSRVCHGKAALVHSTGLVPLIMKGTEKFSGHVAFSPASQNTGRGDLTQVTASSHAL